MQKDRETIPERDEKGYPGVDSSSWWAPGLLATTMGDAVKPGRADAGTSDAEVIEQGETVKITLLVNGRRRRLKVEPPLVSTGRP